MQDLLNFRNVAIRNLISILLSIFISYTSQKSSSGWRVVPAVQVSFISSVVARGFCSPSVDRLHTLVNMFSIRAFYFRFYAWFRASSECSLSGFGRTKGVSSKYERFKVLMPVTLPASAENGGTMFFRNVGGLVPHYMTSHPGRQCCSSSN